MQSKYFAINTNSSALGTALLSGSSQLFILVIGIPVNIDMYVMDSGVGNRVWRLWNLIIIFWENEKR